MRPALVSGFDSRSRSRAQTAQKENTMKTLTVTITGVAPLCFRNERLANHTDPYTKELKRLSKKRSKTDEDLEAIKWVEWRGGWYEDAKGRPVLPSDNVLACLIEGAKKNRHGKLAKTVLGTEEHYVLKYDGPPTIEAMRGNENFCDYRGVVVSGRRIMRARPIIHEWSTEVGFMFDPAVFDESDLLNALTIAGEQIGTCDRRPRWGRFVVEA